MVNREWIFAKPTAGELATAIEHLIALAHVGVACVRGGRDVVAVLQNYHGCLGPADLLHESSRKVHALVSALKDAQYGPG